MPTAAPTWTDLYNEYTNQDWFKKQQANYGGQIDRAWNADDDVRAVKQTIDNNYLSRLAEYNAANGTNLAPDQKMLGADAQPNDYNRKQNSSGWLNQIGINPDTLLSAAALGLGGYGLYSSGLLGGGAAAAAAPSYAAEAVLSGAAPGAASMGGLTAGAAAGGLGGALGSTLSGVGSSLGGIGSAISGGLGAVNSVLGGNLGAIAGGLLGAAASGDTKTEATSQKDPWGPAQSYLKDNLKKNAAMQAQYAANPFSDQQKTAYQNSFNDSDNFRNNVAPGLLGMVNSFQPYVRQRTAVGQGGYAPAQGNSGLLSPNMQAPQGGNFGQIDWSQFLPKRA